METDSKAQRRRSRSPAAAAARRSFGKVAACACIRANRSPPLGLLLPPAAPPHPFAARLLSPKAPTLSPPAAASPAPRPVELPSALPVPTPPPSPQIQGHGGRSFVAIAPCRQILSIPNYVARARLGTPAQTLLVAIDPSNNAAWVPCSACRGCAAAAPSFSLTQSSTYRTVSCGSPQCTQVPRPSFPCGAGSSCAFNLTYRSSTFQALLGQDTLGQPLSPPSPTSTPPPSPSPAPARPSSPLLSHLPSATSTGASTTAARSGGPYDSLQKKLRKSRAAMPHLPRPAES